MKVSKETIDLKVEELENDGVDKSNIIIALIDFFGSLPVINWILNRNRSEDD